MRTRRLVEQGRFMRAVHWITVALPSNAEALPAIQTLKDWEEQQDHSSRKVVRQLKDIEKRVKALQISHLQQRTLDSYFT